MVALQKITCPHCGTALSKWRTPEPSTWGTEFQYICFNDKCEYYVRGWQWMQEKFNAKSSYRYRYNPVNGESGPVPVWSPDALKNDIIQEIE
ncbi:MAG: hypothetical protein A2161_21765 [Candidatus Schekmanbacteria bacterium RBG_13_48_7]|uniref:Zinc finger Ogr/Delta-type domain-containing protein n=1 Tax=Candidatus Schekmanbacteria bacterium RBG_13_48_7 TaxID=1817878 RepID=A0A1F7S0N7_9BACT|nr:MAG: hypothetical protein A2161_21765 [Candidatus Schekmanbacteria bacterium RBG_13_48_7]